MFGARGTRVGEVGDFRGRQPVFFGMQRSLAWGGAASDLIAKFAGPGFTSSLPILKCA